MIRLDRAVSDAISRSAAALPIFAALSAREQVVDYLEG
jgi:hypothetical protein